MMVQRYNFFLIYQTFISFSFVIYDNNPILSLYFVTISSPCRNNFDKNQANFLESAQNPRTFATVI